MFILRNRAGNIHGPYATRAKALWAKQANGALTEYEPVSIGKRTIEEAVALGAAITSEKVRRGRPPLVSGAAKRNKTLRLSPDVIALIEANTVERVEDVLRAGLG